MTTQKNREAWKQIQDKQHKPKGEGSYQQPRKEQQKEKRPNFLVYNGRIALRFYTKMLQEALLALMLVAPLWLYFQATGTASITISTDLPTLLGIAFLMFLVQSFMFQKG